MYRKYNHLRGQTTGVHEQIKNMYAENIKNGEIEATYKIKGRKFRIDILDKEHNIAYEIQRHNFGIRFYDKIDTLINYLRVIIVHPVVIRQKVTRMKNGRIMGTNYVNKTHRNDFYSLFEKLVSFKTLFMPEKMGFDVLLIREHVLKEFTGILLRSKRSRYRMTHRELMSIEKTFKIRKKSDFLGFLPKDLPEVFTNRNIIEKLIIIGNERRKRRIVGCLTYSLCNLGLIELVGTQKGAHKFRISE